MVTIDDALRESETEGGGGGVGPAAPESGGESPGVGLIDLLLCQTGEGQAEEYVTHPLNLPRTLGMAYVLRGLTGIASRLGLPSLRLALIDIVQGLWMQFRPKSAAPQGQG